MSKKTIAIIGATENMGSALAKSLAKGNYRLLLFAHDTKKLNSLAEEIKKQTLSADIEPMGCAAEASWEADIIIPDIPVNEENEMAKKIRQFANRKIVITNGKEDLQKLLPGARVIRVFNPSVEINFSSPLIDGKQTDAFIAGSDKEALDTVAEIIRMTGFNPVFANTNNIYKSKKNTMTTTKWLLDPTHSEIHFKVRHLMVSYVTGNFKQFNAEVETEGDDISTAKVKFTADINSISTNNDQRDAHLRTGDFFDAENHPQLIFESDKLEKIPTPAGTDGYDENYKLYGTLTMRGISKKVVLNVEYGGITQDPWGNTRTGFSVSGKINRKDFGVSFGMVTESGGALLGYDVAINANVEFVKQVKVEKQAA